MKFMREKPGLEIEMLLTYDKFSEQKKHQVLTCLVWLVFTRRQTSVNLLILIFCHLKNSSDGAFGCLKILFLELDFGEPEDMMRFIKDSSIANRCIPGVDVSWIRWKELLEIVFRMFSYCYMKNTACLISMQRSPEA